MKYKKKIIISLILVGLLVVSLPYLKVEILTWKHESEFSTLYEQSGMLNDVEYLKVMKYTKDYAKVYYVVKGKTAGLVYYFGKNGNGKWHLDNWDAVWSTSGSADNFIWPYYR